MTFFGKENDMSEINNTSAAANKGGEKLVTGIDRAGANEKHQQNNIHLVLLGQHFKVFFKQIEHHAYSLL